MAPSARKSDAGWLLGAASGFWKCALTPNQSSAIPRIKPSIKVRLSIILSVRSQTSLDSYPTIDRHGGLKSKEATRLSMRVLTRDTPRTDLPRPVAKSAEFSPGTAPADGFPQAFADTLSRLRQFHHDVADVKFPSLIDWFNL
jgi:hypothetical protein